MKQKYINIFLIVSTLIFIIPFFMRVFSNKSRDPLAVGIELGLLFMLSFILIFIGLFLKFKQSYKPVKNETEKRINFILKLSTLFSIPILLILSRFLGMRITLSIVTIIIIIGTIYIIIKYIKSK